MNEISVIITFCGRKKHLVNTLKGLENGRILPDEVILIEMGQQRTELPDFNLDIKYALITDFKNDYLPMSRARNHGAILASFGKLVFLDVDCIPSYNFIFKIKNKKFNERAVYMGLPMYLTKSVDSVSSLIETKRAVEHPGRPKFEDSKKCEDYGLFWSLCFFIEANLFFEMGGFDETYLGYGIEDTDLAWKCRNMKVDFYLTRFKVFHQPHGFQRPPLSSLESIVKNCNHFYQKWKHWPMSKQLQKFRELNLIQWNEHQKNKISITKLPTEAMMAAARVTGEPFA